MTCQILSKKKKKNQNFLLLFTTQQALLKTNYSVAINKASLKAYSVYITIEGWPRNPILTTKTPFLLFIQFSYLSHYLRTSNFLSSSFKQLNSINILNAIFCSYFYLGDQFWVRKNTFIICQIPKSQWLSFPVLYFATPSSLSLPFNVIVQYHPS